MHMVYFCWIVLNRHVEAKHAYSFFLIDRSGRILKAMLYSFVSSSV